MSRVTNLIEGNRLPTFTRQVTVEKMTEFEKVIWDRGRNAHTDEGAARRDGLTRPLASGQNQMAFLHELLEQNFGDGWVFGGKISVRYIHPVYGGDRITPNAVVTRVNYEGDPQKVHLEIWCENQDGQKTAAGTAVTGPPSKLNSWID